MAAAHTLQMPLAAAADTQHYTVAPFSLLPPTVADAIFQRLNRLNLAECSLACKAWRHLPLTFLYQLRVSDYSTAPPANLLPLCWRLREIHVSSNVAAQWGPLANVLAAHRLPSLRLLAIQHSSHTSREDLLHLQNIMKMQAQHCRLHLALTDKASLQALLDLLPFPGLVHLDFNVPYLPEGAATLLANAAALQAAGASSRGQQQQQHPPGGASSAAAAKPTGGDADLQRCLQQQQQQGSFSVGVWVCCWGGCPGIDLPEVLKITQQLQAVGCSLHGIESINCSSNGDVAAMGQAVQHLKGLRSLGFNYTTRERVCSVPLHLTEGPSAAQHSTAATASSASKSNSVGSTGWTSAFGPNTATLTALLSLSSSLRKLTMHGCPYGGFENGFCAESSGAAEHGARATAPASTSRCASTVAGSLYSQHPIAALTKLTKLSLLKQWHVLPMPLPPIAQLTGLVELAIERDRLADRAELSCLSRLTRLKSLSLVLATADGLQSVIDRIMPWEQPQLPTLYASQQQTQVRGQSGLQQEACSTAAQQQHMQEHQLANSMQQLQLHVQQPAAAGHCCTCCCSDTLHTPSPSPVDAAPAPPAGTTAEAVTAFPTAPQDVLNMLQGVAACACSQASSPAVLDWTWMQHLHRLQTAWLQVPHIDLSCLPSSLTELDAQQWHDLTAVSITCQGRLQLPSLRRLVLPQTRKVTLMQEAGSAQSAGLSAAAARHPAEDAGVQAVLDVAGFDDHDESSSGAEDSEENEQEQLQPQLHHNALLLLKLCAACPELRELELVQWELPAAVVMGTAKQFRYLRLLSLLQPEGTADVELMQQGLVNAAGVAVQVKLQGRLVQSTYPWSSVLAVR